MNSHGDTQSKKFDRNRQGSEPASSRRPANRVLSADCATAFIPVFCIYQLTIPEFHNNPQQTTTDSRTSGTQAINTYPTGNSLSHPLHVCDTCCAWIAGDWAKFEFQVCMSCPSRRDRLTAALETSHSELIAAWIYPSSTSTSTT